MTADQIAVLGAFYRVEPDPDFPMLHRCTCRACGRVFAVGEGDTSRYTFNRLVAHAASHPVSPAAATPAAGPSGADLGAVPGRAVARWTRRVRHAALGGIPAVRGRVRALPARLRGCRLHRVRLPRAGAVLTHRSCGARACPTRCLGERGWRAGRCQRRVMLATGSGSFAGGEGAQVLPPVLVLARLPVELQAAPGRADAAQRQHPAGPRRHRRPARCAARRLWLHAVWSCNRCAAALNRPLRGFPIKRRRRPSPHQPIRSVGLTSRLAKIPASGLDVLDGEMPAQPAAWRARYGSDAHP
jgi:hypothetical protein